MAISTSDVIALSQAHANFSELAEDVREVLKKSSSKTVKPSSPSLTQGGWTISTS